MTPDELALHRHLAALPAEQRYIRDVAFRALVDWAYEQILLHNYTPTELREAVMLAAIRYSERYPLPAHWWTGIGQG